MNERSKALLALGLVALLQTVALAYLVYERVALLRGGREIVVEVVPVDPRDLFRGDYVILGYAFGRTGDIDVGPHVRNGDALFVTLAPKGGATWEMLAAGSEYPDSVAPDNVVIKGIVSNVWQTEGSAKANVRYGIESYFVPEGTGRELEERVRDKKIDAVIAVGTGGEAAIKALVVDGQRVVVEPLL